MVPYNNYWSNLGKLMQHKRPTALDFILKPGLYIILVFWFFYLTGLVYYSGRDHQHRKNMTKAQNRDDLAEMKDNDI